MAWIKTSDRLPPKNKSVKIRRLHVDGRAIWEDTAILNYYDGYYWDGLNGIYELDSSIEWEDELVEITQASSKGEG